MSSENLSKFFRIQKQRFGRCLEPNMVCEKKAIRAHSVQNANALEYIADNNHVYELKLEVKDNQPECTFKLVGRNNASTFTGFCSDHDAEIFRPVDTKPLSLDDQEQLFLLAYRSVTRELHATLEGAMRIQSTYLSLVEDGKVPADEPSGPGVEAVQHMMKAWAVWKYRAKFFDPLFESHRFADVRHLSFKIENERPRIAASSFFSADLKPWGKPFAAIVVNVIPTGPEETTVLFSYSRSHARRAVKYLAPIMQSKGERQKYELSYLLIDRAENFFLNPSVVKGWPEAKKNTIKREFFDTVMDGSPKRVKDLMLF